MVRKSSQQLREEYFDLGAQAIARYRPDHPRCYVCPLCGRVFLEEALAAGDLTLEHAPLKALRGRAVALTCATCNSRAGTCIDPHMVEGEQLLDFAQGTMRSPLRGRFRMGDLSMNANVLVQGESWSVDGLPHNNPPGTGQSLQAEMERLIEEKAWEGTSLHVEDRFRYRHRTALVGWLRSAYLLAFAALGYWYITRPPLQTIREQIAEPDREAIKTFHIVIPEAAPRDRSMVMINEPTYLRSMFVQMGRHGIFLPHLDDNLGIYERLSEDAARQQRFDVEFHGKTVPWPNRPVLALDFK